MPKHKVGALVYYTSSALDKLGIKHGFFTRLGGASGSPLDSLNVKHGIGDSNDKVDENRRRICESLRLDYSRLVFARLGHGDNVYELKTGDSAAEVDNFDALISRAKSVPVMLSTADCVPIVLADKKASIAALVHVSWRSLVAGIIEQTLKHADPGLEFIAALGPAIGPEHYEVKEDFIQIISPKYSKFLRRIGKKYYFDLPSASEYELRRLGVTQIDNLGIDTYTHTDEFYSHRKEGETGRFATLVSL